MSKPRVPAFYDLSTLVQAGIDPATGLPRKVTDGNPCVLKENIRSELEIIDYQDHNNRYVWYNLPSGLTGQLIERILYYRGQAALFYYGDSFYFLPYSLNGTIDVYGRYTGITPLPYNGGTTEDKDKGEKPWVDGLVFKPIYDIAQTDERGFLTNCVILKDYTPGLAETIIPRATINRAVIDCMSEAFPLARTNLIVNSGVKGIRVPDGDANASLQAMSAAVETGAMTGNPWIPITSPIEFQDFSQSSASKAEEYLLYMQALDNYRLSLYGLDQGGIFQKRSHMLQSEADTNQGNAGLIYQDGLTLRQAFCDIANAQWNLGIACVMSECVSGMDKNMDGEISDDQDQNGTPGQQPEIVGEDNE